MLLTKRTFDSEPNHGIVVKAIFPRVYLLEVGAATLVGDSGSPITDPATTGMLVGMRIGGNVSKKIAAMLLRWQRFDPKRYTGARNAERWEPVTPAT